MRTTPPAFLHRLTKPYGTEFAYLLTWCEPVISTIFHANASCISLYRVAHHHQYLAWPLIGLTAMRYQHIVGD